jgi:hypothetical protein
MRLGTFMVVLFVMYLLMGLVDKTLDPNLIAYGTTGTTFLDILIQPWAWTTNSFLLLLVGSVFTISAITAATSVLTRSDILTLAGLAGVFISMGSVPIIRLYDFMTRNIGPFISECIPGQACLPASMLGALTAGVVALMFAMTVLEWWLWRPTTQ